MKKSIAFVLSLTCIMTLLAGCTRNQAQITTEFDKEVNNFNGVTMTLVEDSVTATSISSTLLNETDLDVIYGSDYELQKLADGKWYSLSYLIDNWGFTAEAYSLPKGEPVEETINWETFHGVLSQGSYRVVKKFMDFRGTGDYDEYYIAVEFIID